MPRPGRRFSTRRRRSAVTWIARLGLLVRVLCFACTLQLSGAPHVVASLLGPHAGCIDRLGAPCGDDDKDCPPDCPDCYCPHGHAPSLPPAVALAVPGRVARELPTGGWSMSPTAEPLMRDIAPLERPPRA